MKKSISFGTDGIRGHSDEFPFNKDSLNVLGTAIGHWAFKKYKKKSPKVLIGYDTRLSGPRIRDNLIEGLNTHPIIIVDGGILPTPAIYSLISKNSSFDLGIAISASHNPFFDNGIKLFDSKKCKISQEDEKIIESLFNFYHESIDRITLVVRDQTHWIDASKVYFNSVYSNFTPNYLSGIKVILDCANGATFEIAPQVFKRLGAEIITLGSTPNGKNINDKCGSLYPEKLKSYVLLHKADIGFAFDGDGDRVIAISKFGEIKDGDDLLNLLVQHPSYKKISEIVTTVTANQGFELALKKIHKNLIRTNVGDKYVAAVLKEKNLLIGGESCGHIIIKDYMITGDGIFVALKILESVIANKNWELKTFEKYPQISVNIPVKEKRDLSQKPYSDIIKKHKDSILDGRIIIRYSGTENFLRIITEATTNEIAQNIASNLANQLQEALAK